MPFIMKFLQNIFGKKQSFGQKIKAETQSQSIEQIQEETNKLWALLCDTVEYYKMSACPCAFPRFIQYTSIDCRETHNSFYMSEAEGFIQFSGDCFESQEIDKGDESYKAIYTCKTCGSKYIKAWSDFSIRVSRNYLKPIELKASQLGADAENPIPYFVGLFGHSYPDRAGFKWQNFDTFKEYIRALKTGT
jgi:hypothetical protein